VPRLLLSVLAAVTLALALGGATGLWPTGAPPSQLEASTPSADGARVAARPEAPLTPAAQVVRRDMEGSNAYESRSDVVSPTPDRSASTALTPRSGHGRRAVFDMSRQRVWLVGPAGRVRRTYLVSGSKHDNLDPGHYEVYSRSMHAVSYTYEETMRYMVRFAEGDNATIGFHDIPVDQQGNPVQTRAQLGQPMSSGCIRQARPDARAMWRFAEVGTEVVVVR
jgi:L,D-transpeptidase catalytic domain